MAREAGVPEIEAGNWNGFVVYAATPPVVIARLNAEINKVLATPDVRELMRSQGMIAAASMSARWPPTKATPLPLAIWSLLPDSGASTKRMPHFAARTTNASMRSGSQVLVQRMRCSLPGFAPSVDSTTDFT